ncbi:MAG: T9SS type A sorting domain-containing protein [Sphingobacteriales bacterium]|nr:T9SS type A sorting domain-containing protein [Sphingobacteriales bacterium]
MKNFLSSVLALLLCAGAARAQVPVLSSYPSATAVMFLDFDGHTVSGTSWNSTGPIICAPSGLDNAKITTIFNRVAEDYRPFNINITTDSTKYLAAPIANRMRVILTPTYEWYGAAGGVAFVNSFIWGDDTPCFVFTGLLNYNVKNIAEAAAHEAGHTLGLFHQASYDANCVKTSDYNAGQGSGEIGWAPIMGVGYYQNFTLWNNGPNSFGCTNYQSDLSVITSSNGFTYRPDDYTGSFAAAANIPFTNNQFTINGIIGQSNDQDLIKFTQPSYGRFQLSAIPYNVGTGNAGSDLDMQVTLFSSTQTQLNVYNPGTLLSSVIDTSLNAGTYYLRVEGKGNLYAPNYASLGSYALQGNFTEGIPLPLRQLTLQGQLNGERHQLSWIVDADEAIISQVLEVSTDGRSFAPVKQAAPAERSFSYKPIASGNLLYRLNVTFDNERQYYSNVVTLRNSAGSPRPRIISNLTESNTLSVISPGNYDFLVCDFNGRTLARGILIAGINTITANGMTSGMYLVRFSKDGQQWTEKIIRQ